MVRLKKYENIYSLDLEKEETHEEEDFVHSFVPSEVFLEMSGQRFSVNAVKYSVTDETWQSSSTENQSGDVNFVLHK